MIFNRILMASTILSFVRTGLGLSNNGAITARAIRFTSSSSDDITTSVTRYVTISSITTLDSTVTVSSTLNLPSSSPSVMVMFKSISTKLSPASAVISPLEYSSSTSCLSTMSSLPSDVSSTSSSNLATSSSVVPRSSDVSFTSSASAIESRSIERTTTSTSTIFNTQFETIVITVYVHTSSSAASHSITSIGIIGAMASSAGAIDSTSNPVVPLSVSSEFLSTVTETLFSTTTVHISRASSTLLDTDSCLAPSTTYITVYGATVVTGITFSAMVDGTTASMPSIVTSGPIIGYQTNDNGTATDFKAGTSNYTSSVIPPIPLQSDGDSIEKGFWDIWLAMGSSVIVFLVNY